MDLLLGNWIEVGGLSKAMRYGGSRRKDEEACEGMRVIRRSYTRYK